MTYIYTTNPPVCVLQCTCKLSFIPLKQPNTVHYGVDLCELLHSPIMVACTHVPVVGLAISEGGFKDGVHANVIQLWFTLLQTDSNLGSVFTAYR